MSSTNKVKGFSDILFPEVEKYLFMEEQARELFSRYGYKEIRIPIIEKTELFSRSIGDETDVVQKEMYTFQDKKGRFLTLRPEATAGVVRAYIENKLFTKEQTSKLFTCGPMFRYERPQKGRTRQFHQINVELFGSAAPEADAEIILMLWTYLQSLGLSDLRLELNSLGCRKCRKDYLQALKQFLSSKDNANLCPDCQRRSQTNPLRVFDCKVPSCQEVLQSAPAPYDYTCDDCQEHFDQVQSIVQANGITYAINKRLVRGLDYYQRTTFEVLSDHIGAQSAVAGGGRYDGLVKDLGGPDIPAIGFACGLERLKLLIPDQAKGSWDFYLAVLSEEGRIKAQSIAQNLREQGLKGLVSFEARSVKSQLREANRLKVKACLMMGSDEIQSGSILIKNMSSGEQNLVNQDHVVTFLEGFINRQQ